MMVPVANDLSPEARVVRAGYWRVTLPSWIVMMALIWPPILYLGIEDAFNTRRGLWIVGAFALSGCAAAWIWWSIAAPRWRLWAYQRVEDIELLDRLAVADRLVWPISHPLTRTEMRTGELRNRLAAFERSVGSQQV